MERFCGIQPQTQNVERASILSCIQFSNTSHSSERSCSKFLIEVMDYTMRQAEDITLLISYCSVTNYLVSDPHI